ncbi:MAG: hypothetical protein IIA03_14945, partial [Proteobacteria bacterium]|nr:hypothetical protein [Pseudomonadota bacterium]
MIPAPTLLSRLAAVCAALLLSPLAASAQVEVKPVKAAAAPAAGAPKAQLDM